MNKRNVLLLFVLFAIPQMLLAQQDRVVMHFVSASTDESLSNVVVMKNGNTLATSDTTGFVTILFTEFSKPGFLIAMRSGYSPDTIHSPAAIIYMQPLSVLLNPAVVRSSKVSKLLHENDEYVVDYDFANGNLIVATYSGNNGGNAKLFLINEEGKVLTQSHFPCEPLSLFRSCVGINYCVCRNAFYRLNLDTGNAVAISSAYNIGLLEGLQQCEQSFNGNLYYRIGERKNFKVTYGMIEKGSNDFKILTKFEEKDVANASEQEWYEILQLMATATCENRNMSKAARKQLARLKWDRGSYAHINMPLLMTTDSLVIFDFFKKKIQYYNLAGILKGATDIQFQWKQSQLFEIIKDEVTEKFYIHRYNDASRQTLEELNLGTGAVTGPVTFVEKGFAEHVRVYNGNIYFLWQGNRGETRQLFIQWMN